METYFITVSKYLFIFLMAFYTWECFSALRTRNSYKNSGIFQRQNGVIFLTYLLGMTLVFFNQKETDPINVIILAGGQLCFLIIVLGIFPVLYPNINKMILSNMCMLLAIGFIILARLDFEGSIKQFLIVSVVSLLSLFVPYIMSKERFLKKLTWVYFVMGIGLICMVLAIGVVSRGAKLDLEVGGFAFQPSEFVKILFVLFLAGFLSKRHDFKAIVISAVLAGAHVMVLVASTDLGSALIFFMIYLFMLYVASGQIRYIFLGFAGFSVAAVVAYHLFGHVRERVELWADPWNSTLIGAGQVKASLFAIAKGGLTGEGLYKGNPTHIPLVKKDFIIAGISEEFGGVFAILIILVCLSCFIAFLVVAMRQVSLFNKLICVGLGIQYATQVVLTVGGAIKMIPLTGVTLPLVSSGGSSILSTLILFAIIQGLAIVGVNNEAIINARKEKGRVKKAKKQQYKSIEHTQELPRFK